MTLCMLVSVCICTLDQVIVITQEMVQHGLVALGLMLSLGRVVFSLLANS